MSTDYQIWLTYNGEAEKVQFPYNPEQVDIKIGSNNESVSISGLGEIMVMQDRPAMVFSFSRFLPSTYFPGMQFTDIYNPYDVAQKILAWKNGNQPVHLIITGTPVNVFCTIEDFPLSEKAGDVGTVYYDLKLVEHRAGTVRQIDVSDGTATLSSGAARVDNRVGNKTYTVKSGDSLYFIAKKELGNGSRWQEIFNLNKDKISNPRKIYPGWVLALPS